MELAIKTIPSEFHIEDKRIKKIKYELPKIPSNMFFLGRCGSGKSSAVYTMLNEGYTHKSKSIFDEIIVYLGSLDSVDTWKQLPCKNVVVLTEFNPDDFKEYLEDLKEHQMERESKKKRRLNVCIVMDDMASEQLVKPLKGRASPLEKLLLTSRHECNATIIFASQTYKTKGFSTPTVRNNLNYIFCFALSRNDVEKVAMEHANNLSKDEFIEMYYEIQKVPYQFLLIDYKRNCFRRGFTDVLLNFNDTLR